MASRPRGAAPSASPARSPRPPRASTSTARVDCEYKACGFVQDLCRNTIGPERGQLIILRPWQHDILHGLFDEQGEPRQRYGYIGLPRKNGKSTLGAALAIYALVCLGPAAHVYSCAGDKKQASIVFDEAKRMVRADPELSGIIRIQRWHLEGPDDSIYRVLSADAELQQGLNPSFVIFDEVHVQPNRDLWDAMRYGMGARPNPMLIGITTAGFDRTTLAWELYEQGTDGQFFWWSEPADPNCDWMDQAAWAEANPALGDFLFADALYDDADGDAKHESGFRRYHLNQWTTTHSAWLPHGTWAACEDKDRLVAPDEPVVLFLDGSWANDSTGIVGATIRAPHHLFTVDLWTPDPGLGHIDMARVEKGLRTALRDHKVVQIAFDPRGFQDFFSRFEAEGFPVVEWPTNSLNRMVPACEEFFRAVLAKLITHDGDPRLAAHIANAVLKEDQYGPRIVKESKTSARKIDLAVCAVGALERAMFHAAQPAPVVARFIPFD